MITDIQTKPATTSDDKFFEPALKNTKALLSLPIEAALTDGAYNSPSNLNFTKQQEKPIKWYLTAIQGAESFYDFEKINEQQYKVTDRRTGHIQFTHRTPKGKFRIDELHAKNKYRYFEPKTIQNYFRRLQIAKYPDWVRGARANTEATIHQLFCTLNGNKTKYRGLFNNHSFAINRAIWVNFRRITAFRKKSKQNYHSSNLLDFCISKYTKYLNEILTFFSSFLINRLKKSRAVYFFEIKLDFINQI